MPDRRLRVLLTHEMYLPQFGGGGEYLVARTAQELAKRDVDVQVLTTGDPAITEHDGIATRRLPMRRRWFPFAIPQITRMAREADIVQTFNYHACLPTLFAARRARKPVVCLFLAVFDEVWKDMKGPVAGRAFMALERHMVRRPFTASVFLGSYSHELALSLGAPADSDVVSIAIDLEHFRPAPEKENRVLFTGKYDVRKGVYDVLEVARRLPHVPFQMMGWGPEEAKLRAEAPPNVEFLPYDHGAPLREALAKAAIFLLPSRGEAFPIALAQAMASGCAVLFTKSLKFHGAYIAPGDTAAITAAVQKLWSDRAAAKKAGMLNADLAREFSWENYTSRLLAIYDRVLGMGAVPVRHQVATR